MREKDNDESRIKALGWRPMSGSRSQSVAIGTLLLN